MATRTTTTKASPRRTPARKTAPAAVAGLYVRISQDRGGSELGVDRQRQDCEKLARARGWKVGPVFADNDLSAFSGRARPAYEQLLEALKAGTIGAVVAWHPDRLHRSPVELERFIDVIEQTSAHVATVTAGELDLSTASGRMTARIVGAVARHESEHKSERLRRQREQMALQGRPHGGRRAFGYSAGGDAVDDAEAELVREAAQRVLAGESLRSVARDWNARKIKSSSGREWSIASLRSMLTGPRLAALRVHRGQVVGVATWPAILTREEHDDIRTVLGNPRVRRAGRPPTSLLGGLIVCGRCKGPMYASTRVNGGRRYVCQQQPGKVGCGRVAIEAMKTEKLIVDVVMRRLDTRRLARVVAQPKDGPGREIPELEERLGALAELFGAGEITQGEWIRARRGIELRLEKARSARDAARGNAVLASYRDGALRARWPDLSIDQRREVIAALIESVVIAPATRGAVWDEGRVSISRWLA
jgi:DNA invertase Pin-like site-specific DNA recombinase